MLSRVVVTAPTKQQELHCTRVQPIVQEICGSGLFEPRGRISILAHGQFLFFAWFTLRNIVLLGLSTQVMAVKSTMDLYQAFAEKRSHHQLVNRKEIFA